MTTDYDKSLEALRKDVKDLQEDMKDLVKALKEGARDKAGSLRDRVEEAVAKGEGRVKEAAESLKECGCKVCEHLEAALKEKPLLAILAAVGAGVILGGLLRRRHHP